MFCIFLPWYLTIGPPFGNIFSIFPNILNKSKYLWFMTLKIDTMVFGLIRFLGFYSETWGRWDAIWHVVFVQMGGEATPPRWGNWKKNTDPAKISCQSRTNLSKLGRCSSSNEQWPKTCGIYRAGPYKLWMEIQYSPYKWSQNPTYNARGPPCGCRRFQTRFFVFKPGWGRFRCWHHVLLLGWNHEFLRVHSTLSWCNHRRTRRISTFLNDLL